MALRILVAEDETIIRLDLEKILEAAGFVVCAAAKDGEEAVELARSEAPDLAILDVKMPGLDGIEAARRILAERPIPIVMLTAYGQTKPSPVRSKRVFSATSSSRSARPTSCRRSRPRVLATPSSRRSARRLSPSGRGARDSEGRRAGKGLAHGARAAVGTGSLRAAARCKSAIGPAHAVWWPRP